MSRRSIQGTYLRGHTLCGTAISGRTDARRPRRTAVGRFPVRARGQVGRHPACSPTWTARRASSGAGVEVTGRYPEVSRLEVPGRHGRARRRGRRVRPRGQAVVRAGPAADARRRPGRPWAAGDGAGRRTCPSICSPSTARRCSTGPTTSGANCWSRSGSRSRPTFPCHPDVVAATRSRARRRGGQARRLALPAGHPVAVVGQGEERDRTRGRDRRLAAGHGAALGRDRVAADGRLPDRRASSSSVTSAPGFSDAALDELYALLAPLEISRSAYTKSAQEIARDARWVRPEIVGEVAYANQTTEGRLRAPPGAACARTRSRRRYGCEEGPRPGRGP